MGLTLLPVVFIPTCLRCLKLIIIPITGPSLHLRISASALVSLQVIFSKCDVKLYDWLGISLKLMFILRSLVLLRNPDHFKLTQCHVDAGFYVHGARHV